MTNDINKSKPRDAPFTLDERVSIMTMCAKGYLLDEIADELCMKRRRVKSAIKSICDRSLNGKRLDIERKTKEREFLKSYYKGDI